MATISVPRSPTTAPTARHDLSNPVFQAFVLLRIGFTVAPILFGLDKFLGWLVDSSSRSSPGSSSPFARSSAPT